MDYGNLRDCQKQRALDTYMHLQLLLHAGDLDRSHLEGRILEFGAFIGTNTQALKNFGGNIEVVDISKGVNEIATRGILPQDKVYHRDGIQLLRENPNTYDLIASFLFGPITNSEDEKFLREFYEVSCIGLKPEGRILLTSDAGSFQYIRKLAQEGYGIVSTNPMFPDAFIGKKTTKGQMDNYIFLNLKNKKINFKL